MNDILKIAAIIVVLFAGYKIFYKGESILPAAKTSQKGSPPANVSKLDVIAAKQAYDKAYKRQKDLEARAGKDENSRKVVAKAAADTAAKQKYFNEALANYQKAGGRITFKN